MRSLGDFLGPQSTASAPGIPPSQIACQLHARESTLMRHFAGDLFAHAAGTLPLTIRSIHLIRVHGWLLLMGQDCARRTRPPMREKNAHRWRPAMRSSVPADASSTTALVVVLHFPSVPGIEPPYLANLVSDAEAWDRVRCA
ncbi:hypothetical protein AURDEDRAFT_166598 [Auricularia subglabra TFB-10046 SS5]|nr:hypothetical protein AURDEDRAFT_166598 [Auricularia subglabra TFB-10046 SS5]